MTCEHHYRGNACEVLDTDSGQWRAAKFVTVDLVGGEPIVQIDKSMPIFATWGSVRGLPRDEIVAYYRAVQDPASKSPVAEVVETDGKLALQALPGALIAAGQQLFSVPYDVRRSRGITVGRLNEFTLAQLYVAYCHVDCEREAAEECIKRYAQLIRELEAASASAAATFNSAIEWALKVDEGFQFLRLWLHGEFDALRKEWPEVPLDAALYNADPLPPKAEVAMEADHD